MDSPFELNAGISLPRGSAKFSVWRIPGTRELQGEQSKIRVPPSRLFKNARAFIAFQDKRHQTNKNP